MLKTFLMAELLIKILIQVGVLKNAITQTYNKCMIIHYD